MFVPPPDATVIESIRGQYNPLQRALIDSHVTLCREDELVSLDRVMQNLKQLRQPGLTLEFGGVVRSEGGKGVLLPVVAGVAEFQRLRRIVLQGLYDNPRQQVPHITLLHPRNSTCTDAIFDAIRSYTLPGIIRFGAISLIEQVDGGPWQVHHTYTLARQ
jgi:2'-5' RNA ligase